ncbi:uncharacterized protein ASPGLDRAFT_21500 [Aspergillus glaucus CBS 516.65]|uniref:Uncharacterized protein n=1 Tax=Aspergillus glaucus CBS 516.65 TaxID=1160497 RepID=A0A1L9VZP9_ASPGL|nr:hypothetical protein ASPGLDRAFT_21500 [Aspergillus glaucus CBS 516.65]OJJ89385.1 hypothetical protein ASPGLDRAFT_21500 [Aspergillus glaucus CBS 516.65]
MTSQDSLAYHEPGITTVLDKIIYCGLIGQLFIGMAWGVPGGNFSWVTWVFCCLYEVAKAVRSIQAKKLYVHFPEEMMSMNFGFVAHMCLLVGMVAGATYTGTSGLFAAYLAGASITWLDELLMTISTDSSTEGIGLQNRSTQGTGNSSRSSTTSQQTESTVAIKHPTGEEVFERLCKEPLKRVLSPLFICTLLPNANQSIIPTKCRHRSASQFPLPGCSKGKSSDAEWSKLSS